MPPLVLRQFPISHYCEKVRWVLDYKALPYSVENQLPGLHALQNRRLVGEPTVPVLIDGHHAIGGSNAIALYLDDQFPERKLIPEAGHARDAVLALEAYFDEHTGVAVRRYVYGSVHRDLGTFRRLFFGGYAPSTRLLGRLLARPVAQQIRKMYGLGGTAIDESMRTIDEAAVRIEQLTGGDASRYLVGDSLTLADVTAASLLGPLLSPLGSPWQGLDLPELQAGRALLSARPAGRWLLARYADDRHTSRPSRVAKVALV